MYLIKGHDIFFSVWIIKTRYWAAEELGNLFFTLGFIEAMHHDFTLATLKNNGVGVTLKQIIWDAGGIRGRGMQIIQSTWLGNCFGHSPKYEKSHQYLCCWKL